jgi:hypothetical protein
VLRFPEAVMKRTESSLMLTQSLDVSTVRSHVAWSEVQRRVLGFEDDVFGEQVSAFCLHLVHPAAYSISQPLGGTGTVALFPHE